MINFKSLYFLKTFFLHICNFYPNTCIPKKNSRLASYANLTIIFFTKSNVTDLILSHEYHENINEMYE